MNVSLLSCFFRQILLFLSNWNIGPQPHGIYSFFYNNKTNDYKTNCLNLTTLNILLSNSSAINEQMVLFGAIFRHTQGGHQLEGCLRGGRNIFNNPSLCKSLKWIKSYNTAHTTLNTCDNSHTSRGLFTGDIVNLRAVANFGTLLFICSICFLVFPSRGWRWQAIIYALKLVLMHWLREIHALICISYNPDVCSRKNSCQNNFTAFC